MHTLAVLQSGTNIADPEKVNLQVRNHVDPLKSIL